MINGMLILSEERENQKDECARELRERIKCNREKKGTIVFLLQIALFGVSTQNFLSV
jgi:hypothetical protein